MNMRRIMHRVSRARSQLVLVALPIVLMWQVVFGGRVLYWGVPLMQFYPWQRLAVESWRMGEAPLWNPYVDNGAPLAANLQTGAFYPLNALYFVLPVDAAMGYTAVLHLILAGWFMYAFMRALGARPLAALIAAIAFQLNGFLIARLAFLSITVTLPWIAAWLWRGERLLQSGRSSDAIWLALVIGMGMLAGHAQTALYGSILLGAYALYRCFIARREGERRGRNLFLILSASVLGIALAAIQLLPAAELARASQRVGGLDYTFAMTHSYWPWRLLTLLTPDLFGNPGYGNFWGYDNYWENAAYIGLLPIALAAGSIWSWWRNRRARSMGVTEYGVKDDFGSAIGDLRVGTGADRTTGAPIPNRQSDLENPKSLIPFFALVALITLVFAFGWFTPIYPFLFRVAPGFSMFQGPARWLALTVVALCVLAGIGAETMRARRGALRRSRKWILAGLALSIAALAAGSILPGRVATFAPATLRLGLLMTVTAIVWGARPAHDDSRSGRWSWVVAGLIAIDLLTAHIALNPTIDRALYQGETEAAQAMRADGDGRVFMFGEDEEAIRERFGVALPFATFGLEAGAEWIDFRESMIPNVSMIDRLPSANNFDSLLVGRSLELRERVNALPLEDAMRVLGMMHVRYIASPRDLHLPVVHRGAAATIYRNDDVLPRAWIAPMSRVESDPLSAMLDPAFDPLREVILEESVNASRNTQKALLTRIDSLHDTPNTVTIRAASDSDGFLILADTWMPGWRATLDGNAVDVLRANGNFRAVRFPAGEHVVAFRYEPDVFRIGAWLSGLGWVLAGVWAFAARRRR
jgi:hypothetical protein